jgi:hypothetical protein
MEYSVSMDIYYLAKPTPAAGELVTMLHAQLTIAYGYISEGSESVMKQAKTLVTLGRLLQQRRVDSGF